MPLFTSVPLTRFFGPAALSVCLFAVCLTLFGAGPARAACAGGDLCAGDRIGPENVEASLDRRFHGQALRDLLPERLLWQIREYGLTLTLADPRPHDVDPRFAESTRRYSKDVVLDPETGEISGWTAGIPFPDVSGDDPQAALKIIWNVARGRNWGDTVSQPYTVFLLINGGSGLERVQNWLYRRYAMKGLLRAGGSPARGDGDVFAKTMLFAMAPQDIKGVGTFNIIYDTGKFDDTWAYVREVRRTRRLAGSSWRDAIGSTDLIADDFAGFSAYPTWYDGFELVGERTILAVANSKTELWRMDGGTPTESYPGIDVDKPPYWNLQDHWEPRDVYVLKAYPPEDHPYGSRLLHIDKQSYAPLFNVIADKSGELWKIQTIGARQFPTEDDPKGSVVFDVFDNMIDYQRNHATVYLTGPELLFNVPFDEGDVSLAAMETIGR